MRHAKSVNINLGRQRDTKAPSCEKCRHLEVKPLGCAKGRDFTHPCNEFHDASKPGASELVPRKLKTGAP